MRRGEGWALLIGFAGLAVIPLFVSNDYWGTVLDTGGTYALVAIGLNLLCGGTGQFSLGHAGFFAVGAITAAITAGAGWPFWLAIPAGGVFAATVGVVIAIPALRVSGPYFAIATLAFGLLAADVFATANWSHARTGFNVNPPQVGGYTFSVSSFFWIVLLLLALGSFAALKLRQGKFGRAWVALRESPAAARANGVNVGWYRVLAFVISTFYAGAGGSLLAFWALYVAAASFGLELSILFIAMIVVGGLDSVIGSIIGAAFLTGVQELLNNAGQSQYEEPIYGAVIVIVLLLVPGGLIRAGTLARDHATFGRGFLPGAGTRG